MRDKKQPSGAGGGGTPIFNVPYEEPAFHYATTPEGKTVPIATAQKAQATR